MRLVSYLLVAILSVPVSSVLAGEVRDVTLEKQWEVGGLSEAEGELFGVLVDVAVDAAGRTYLLDRQITDVKVFDADGRYVRTIGRKGEGPGEFRMPTGITVLPDGRISVVDSGRIICFDTEGEYAGSFPNDGSRPGGFEHFGSVQSRGGLLAMFGLEMRFADGHMNMNRRVVRLDADGSRSTVIMGSDLRWEVASNRITEKNRLPIMWRVGPDGLVYIVRSADYEIEVRDGDGTLVRTIATEYEHRPRTREEKQDVEAYYRRGGGTQGVEIDVMDYQRDIEWFDVADTGQVWVLSSRGADAADDDSLGTFDVYDPDGTLESRVALHGEGDPRRDRYYLIGERMIVLTRYAESSKSYQRGFAGSDTSKDRDEEEEALPMSVICYAIPE